MADIEAALNLPPWAQQLPEHLSAVTLDGRVVIVYRRRDGVFWDSNCPGCRGRTAVQQIMPDHDAMPNCRSGRRAHCTCDTCF